jgi:hypothetical protein
MRARRVCLNLWILIRVRLIVFEKCLITIGGQEDLMPKDLPTVNGVSRFYNYQFIDLPSINIPSRRVISSMW